MQYPEFVNNRDFYALHSSLSAEEQLLSMVENLKAVEEITTQHYDDFQSLIHAYLQCGLKVFGMETGIVSHITDGCRYTVEDVVSVVEGINPQDVFELEGTYCHEVYKTQTVICFPHVGNHATMKGHPVYLAMQLESYISAPIYVDDELYGTLNFTSRNVRDYGFSEHERDLITLLSNSIGNFLLLRREKNKLAEANEKMKTFIGYVAHDLRNPLGVIQTLSTMASSRQLSSDRMQKILEAIKNNATHSNELITALLDHAALGTGRITLDIAAVSLKEVIHSSLEGVTLLFEGDHDSQPHLQLEELSLLADSARIKQVLDNLIINAFKFSAKPSDIDITLINLGNGFAELSITNVKADNPQKSIKSSSSALHSTGFGLDIAKEILSAHDSELIVEDSHHRFSTKFQLKIAN